MAEGGFASSQGGVSRVPNSGPEDSYPSGNGECRDDAIVGSPMPEYEGHGPGWFNHKTYAGGTPVGMHHGSIEPHGNEARKQA